MDIMHAVKVKRQLNKSGDSGAFAPLPRPY